jgi:hydroxyquinol 1,2-dioxygenase
VIIESQEDVTQAVLAGIEGAPDPRVRELLSALVRHLHEFVRETELTEQEFQTAIGYVNAIGQNTTPSHNEAMVIAGALGVSNLVCLLNNGDGTGHSTQANNLGPFWRADAPHYPNGASLLITPTPGEPLFFNGWVRDPEGNPVAGVEVDVWHSSPVGLYENQDPDQPEMNLRGVFTTDENGSFSFRSIRPAGYPVPVDGPLGPLLEAQGRLNMRPAHLHFLLYKPGFKTIASQVYTPDDPHIETDSQYGVTRALIGEYVLHEDEPAPADEFEGPWYSLEFTFVIEPGEARRPVPPISAKVGAG